MMIRLPFIRRWYIRRVGTQQDKRLAARITFTVHGHLYGRDGASLGVCRFQDVSERGARVAVGKSDQIPDELIVVLSRCGSVRRQAKVVWRTQNELGIRFEQKRPE